MGQDGLLYDVTYQQIHRDIMDLSLEPGTALSVRKIAEKYKVGRTPAREAMMRLQKENLVHIYPQSGTVVSKLSIRQIEEERFIRQTLEIASVDDFIKYKGPLVTDAMEYILGLQKKALTVDATKEFFAQDNNFHRLIFEMAGKNLAWKTINTISSHYNRFRFLTTTVKGLNWQILDQHEQILGAARADRADETKRLLDDHLSCIKNEYDKILAMYPQYFAAEARKQVLPVRLDSTD